jgi:hypothetical protein
MRIEPIRRAARAALVAAAAAAVVGRVGSKAGAWAHPPRLLAALALGACALAAVELALSVADVIRRRRPLASAGRAAVLAGLIGVAGGGLANWLFAIRGFVLLMEGDAMPLAGGRHVERFQGGLLADPGELDAVVNVAKVELKGDGAAFYPEAVLVVSRPGSPDEQLVLRHGSPVSLGPLRLHLGAFGFAPRIVVLHGDDTLLDAVVPFGTRGEGKAALVFEGETDTQREGLHVAGAVTLASENPGVPGHPTVLLELRRGDQVLGSGELKLGHFADLGDGYRIGAAGLKKWVEVDLSRRTYPVPIVGGLALLLVGAALWGFGARTRR